MRGKGGYSLNGKLNVEDRFLYCTLDCYCMSLERNIPLLYAYSFLIKRVSMPIIVLYFLLHQLSLTQVGLLAGVMSLISVLTEVHGGVFADVYGGRASFLFHAVFGFFTMLFYFVGDSFWWFFVASMFYGLAGAFITGTREAFLWESLAALKRRNDFKKVNGRVVFSSHVLNSFVLLVVPVLYLWSVKAPFVLGMLFFAGAIVCAFFLVDPPRRVHHTSTNGHILSSFRDVLDSKVLFPLLLLAFGSSVYVVSSHFFQPLFVLGSVPVVLFGVVFAGMRIVEGTGALFAHLLERYFSNRSLLLSLFFLFSLLLFSFSQSIGFFVAILIIVFSSVKGVYRVVADDELNKGIHSKRRTTIFSIANLTSSLLVGVFSFMIGILADNIGLREAFLVASVFCFFVLVVLILWKHSLFFFRLFSKTVY